MTRVGDGHPLADPGRAQFLTAEDRPRHALEVSLAKAAGMVEAADDLADRLFLAGCLKIDDDRLAYHEIRKLHPALHRRAAGPAPSAGTPRRYTGTDRPPSRGADGAAFASRCQGMFKGRSGGVGWESLRLRGLGKVRRRRNHFPQGHVSFVI